MPTPPKQSTANLRMLVKNIGRRHNAHDALLSSLPLIDTRKERIERELFTGSDGSSSQERVREISGDEKPV